MSWRVIAWLGIAVSAAGCLSSRHDCDEPRPGCTEAQCLAGDCVDGTVFRCEPDTGEWVASSTVCEGHAAPVDGTLVVAQRVASISGTCPALAPRSPVVLEIAPDDTVTATAPTTLVAGHASTGTEAGSVTATLTDTWRGAPVSMSYALQIDWHRQVIAATGAATVDGCDAALELSAALCPAGVVACPAADASHTVRCIDGVVTATPVDRYRFCAPDTTTEVCAVATSSIAACPGACVDGDARVFDTDAAYAAFDPRTLCAP
ncbi:MAG: hypothetical protein H6709_12050 [Kofleriaceae bacterium]|nr:hypothetical protein [Myxococcales bacterium]MCB9564760.1 hypothetical protein [Kofleriaceae bacterium]MCB9572809.1 hypothetical protein [Kofleriaceae bacterium]